MGNMGCKSTMKTPECTSFSNSKEWISQKFQCYPCSSNNESLSAQVGQHLDKKETRQLFFEDGSKYEGDVVNGQMHGLGVLTWANGSQYRGEFNEHKLMGQGKLILVDGSRLEGEFKEGSLNGLGKRYNSSGLRVYEGFLKDAKRCGYGKEYTDDTANTLYYEGEWENNVKCGKGKMYCTEGAYIEGIFVDDSNGHGKYYDKDGVLRYEGEINDEGKTRKGTYILDDGSRQEGEFKNDDRHGLIQEYDASGNLEFEGFYKDDKRCGYGKYYDENEVLLLEGEWEDGEIIWGRSYFETYYIEGKFINSQICGQGKRYAKKDDFLEYEGEFKDGEMCGQGKYFFRDEELGRVYEGHFKNSQLNGLGRLYLNGRKYFEGQFKDDQITGQGKYICEDGSYCIGEFKAGLVQQRIKEFSACDSPKFEGFHENNERCGYGKEYVKRCPSL